MASDQRNKTRAAHHAASTPDGEAPWGDLEMTVPTDRDHASIVALVECALVELTHEAVGAVFISRQVGRSTRTQYVAADDVGEQFQKRHFDDRLGWHETTVPRETVRDELITRLARPALSVSKRALTSAVDNVERFHVTSIHDLQQPRDR